MMNVKLHRLTKIESRVVNLYSDGKYNEAIELAQRLLESAKLSKDNKTMMNAYLNLAGCYYNLGEIESAFENILEYKRLCDEYGDERDKYYLYSLSALIYEFEENLEEAKKAIQKCIYYAMELEMYYSASVSFNTYSSYLVIDQNYEEAIKNADIAMDFAKEYCPGDILLQCQIYMNIAAAYIGMGKYDMAMEILEPLEFSPYLNNNLHEKAHYLFTLATLHHRKNEYNQALDLLHQAYDIITTFNDKVMLKNITKEMAEIYEKIGNYEKAVKLMKTYINFTQELHNLRLSSKVQEFDIKQSIAAIEKRANIDCLSGVYNRYYLEATCNKWLKEAKETNSHVCCIVLDIDHFKSINDTFGHLVGDEVIKAVGKACLEVINGEETMVGRYGGDEFVALLKNYPSQQIMQKAQELFNAITNAKVQYQNNTIQITTSIGVVCTESIGNAKKFTQIFNIADQALYMAKKQGKNQIVTLYNCNIEE